MSRPDPTPLEPNQPRHYRLELGINLNAATIPRTNPNMRLFPLQDALVDITDLETPKAAWYSQLAPGDTMTFRLLDISNLSESTEPIETYPSVALADFIFTDPNSGESSNPFVEQVTRWQFARESESHWSPPYSRRRDQSLMSWGIHAEDSAGTTLPHVTLAAPETGRNERFTNLAVVIWTRRQGFIDQFIFDPEMIVGDIGN